MHRITHVKLEKLPNKSWNKPEINERLSWKDPIEQFDLTKWKNCAQRAIEKEKPQYLKIIAAEVYRLVIINFGLPV